MAIKLRSISNQIRRALLYCELERLEGGLTRWTLEADAELSMVRKSDQGIKCRPDAHDAKKHRQVMRGVCKQIFCNLDIKLSNNIRNYCGQSEI